jgi:hypothetical protein
MSQTFAAWIPMLAFMPTLLVLIVAMRAAWKLVNEVNAAVPPQERYRHWGSDPVRAWGKHEALFPEREPVRRNVRWLFGAVLALTSMTAVSAMFVK